MIDTFVQIKQKLTTAYRTISELREKIETNDQKCKEREMALALLIIQRLDQCEEEEDQATFLSELLHQMGVSRIPSPIDRSPEYSRVTERIKKEGVPSGTVLRVSVGAFVKGDQLIRPAALVVAK